MDNKGRTTKKIVIPVITAIMLLSQATGCSFVSSKELVDLIDKGENIELIVNDPDYTIEELGTLDEDVTWVQLDQLKTYNMGFRQGFDELFNINTILEGTGGKQGCLYVVATENGEARSGNTTISDAFRNKVFIEKYWDNNDVKHSIKELATEAYSDIEAEDDYAINASLNAYFNLFNDSKNPDAFNGGQSVTREQFYTMLFKATEPVRDLNYKASTDTFAKAVGGDTEYTRYAKEVESYNFITAENKGLDSQTISAPISRLEAIYMIVNRHFNNLLQEADSSLVAYYDAENAGDLALSAGFKYEEDGEVKEKDNWQKFTLTFMYKHPDKGIQEELYKSLIVAKQVGLVPEENCRWDEALSKNEAIDLIVNMLLAKNNLEGYLTYNEYADMELVETEDPTTGLDVEINISDDIIDESLNNVLTLDQLEDFQIEEFELIAEDAANRVKNKEMTIEEADVYSEQMVGMDIAALVFPSNGVELFRQWKDETGYYEQFESEDVESSSSSSSQTEQNEQIVDTQKSDTSVKPKPSEEQKADQVENNTSGGSTDNGDDSNVIPGMEEVPDGTVWGTEDNNGTWINADYIRDRLPDYLKE